MSGTPMADGSRQTVRGYEAELKFIEEKKKQSFVAHVLEVCVGILVLVVCCGASVIVAGLVTHEGVSVALGDGFAADTAGVLAAVMVLVGICTAIEDRGAR